jgi:hypothetical protein
MTLRASFSREDLKIVDCDARGTNQAAECSLCQLLVVGNRKGCQVTILHKDDVAASLAVDRPASLLDDLYRIGSAQHGKPGH